MHISSIRLGHANNSSSTHSILLMSPEKEITVNNFDFGWEWFHLRSKKSKAEYLAVVLNENLPKNIPDEHRLAIIRQVTGLDVVNDILDGYLDHQSKILLPSGETDYPDMEFYKDLFDYVVNNEKISIRGGNDNDEFPPDFGGTPIELNTNLNQRTRKDGDWWVLYNPYTGAKVRLSFKENPESYTNSTVPELIDFKITNVCLKNCKFCYQGSEHDGKKADYGFVKEIIHALRHHKVLECAVGGGETTQYPNFTDVLSDLNWHNVYRDEKRVTPNFTSYDMQWSKNPEMVKSVEENCGSFAISNTDKSTLVELYNWNKNHAVRGNLQVVIGVAYPGNLYRTLIVAKELDIGVTFLGYKNTGRGSQYSTKEYIEGDLFKKLSEFKYTKFGADILFVKQFSKEIEEYGIHESLVVGEEGHFSCYIDAVEGKMGPSSYTPDLMHDIPMLPGRYDKSKKRLDVENLFSKFPYTIT